MSKILGLADWNLSEKTPNSERFVNAKIILKYPDPKRYINLKPKQRVEQIDADFKTNLIKLVDLNLFDDYTPTGTKKRPTGVATKIKYETLDLFEDLDFVDHVFIDSIDHATKIKKEKITTNKYFCVKMTVVIEIEGISSKQQGIEERFVLIKATSSEDAYEKLDNQKDEYAEPYLNSDGRFVRWRIHSFDDCYELDVSSLKEFEDQKGIEVFSKLKSKKRITTWAGPSN